MYDEDVKTLIDKHNEMLEKRVPYTIPPISALALKKESSNPYSRKGKQILFAYTFLMVLFTFLSFFLIKMVDEDRDLVRKFELNSKIFLSDNPGSFVSAFRETIK